MDKKVIYYDSVYGITYYSRDELACDLGISVTTLKNKIIESNGNITLAVQRIREKQEEVSRKEYNIDGKVYSLAELADKLGITTNKLIRLKTKWRSEPGEFERMVAKQVQEVDNNERKTNTCQDNANKRDKLLRDLAKEYGLKFEDLKSAYKEQNENIDRAIIQVKIKNVRQIKLKLRNKTINIVNAAYVLGIKQRELILALYNNIPIEQLQCKCDGQEDDNNKDGITAIFEQNLNDAVIWRRWIILWGKYEGDMDKIHNTKIVAELKKYVIKKYGALLRVLLKGEEDKEKEYTKLIKKILSFEYTIEELMEKRILEEKCKCKNLNFEAMRYMYMVSASEIINDDEKETMLAQVAPTGKESQTIQEIKDEMVRVKRLIKLNEVAKVLEGDSEQSVKNDCVKQNGITLAEIETIIFELYKRSDLISAKGISEEDLQRKNVINDTIKKWPNMVVEEREKVKNSEYFSSSEKSIIKDTSDILQHYKAVINSNNREKQNMSKEQ